MTDVLTQQIYDRRRAEIAEHHEAAKTEFRRVALQHERGKAEQAEVDQARSAVAEFEQRTGALEEAWREEQVQATRQAAERDAELRRHVYGDVEALEEQREKALLALVAAVQGLGKFARTYDEISDQIRGKLAPFSKDIGVGGNNEFSELLRTLRERHREAELIAGIMFGEQIWGVGHREAWSNAQQHGVDHLNGMKRRDILRHAGRILPDDDQREAA